MPASLCNQTGASLHSVHGCQPSQDRLHILVAQPLLGERPHLARALADLLSDASRSMRVLDQARAHVRTAVWMTVIAERREHLLAVRRVGRSDRTFVTRGSFTTGAALGFRLRRTPTAAAYGYKRAHAHAQNHPLDSHDRSTS